MSMTFNIVFTPGTVPYLSFFVHSLLKWSDCRFRLVSNGCVSPERRMLRQLCDQLDRLEYLTFPSNGMADHGSVLNYLQAITTEDYFCFMDSDLFATGEFVDPFRLLLKTNSAVFSGAPLWMTFDQGILPSEFQTVSGVHHSTDGGTCLGSTYFAIYDNRVLAGDMQSSGIGFQTYNWADVPQEYQRVFRSNGWQKRSYDTAKVLNLVLQHRGSLHKYLDSNNLCHIGGFSFLPKVESASSRRWRGRIFDRLQNSPLRSVMDNLQQKWRSKIAWREVSSMSESERQSLIDQRLYQRDPTRRYFHGLLMSLAANRELPKRPVIGVSEIDEAIRVATENLQTLHDECMPKRRTNARAA